MSDGGEPGPVYAGDLMVGGDLWRRIFDAIEDPVFIQDADGTILSANRATQNLLDVSEPDLIGNRCYAVVHGTESFIPECPFVRASGSHTRESYVIFMFERWFRISIDPILDDAGRFTGAIHILTDITDIKHLDELRSRLAAIVETSEDAVIGATQDGRIVSMNASASRITGLSRDVVETPNIFSVVTAGDEERWEEAIRSVVGTGEGIRFESVLKGLHDNESEVSVGIAPILDERGAPGGVSFIIHDLTPRRKAERALVAYMAEAALRMKVPLETVAQEIGRMTTLLTGGSLTVAEASTILRVQKAHIDQIVQNLADLNRAVAESDEEIPEAYRHFLSNR
ncbi:PAS domain-containing protein [Methanofollis fontis]|nr:PAS domain-containing protein [Methanofollis fontis]